MEWEGYLFYIFLFWVGIKKKLPADANAAQTAKKTKPIFSGDISLLKTILVIIEAVIEANC